MWTDYFLRAETEAELIAALPMLREGEDWIETGPNHAFDPIPALVLDEGQLAEDGESFAVPPILAPGFHANLRLSALHPARAEIEAAIVSFVVAPDHPRRVFG